MNAFRLISVDIHGHKILGSFHLDFSKDKITIGGVPEDVYTSVIIGKNGIGKSRLLRILSDVFVDLNARQEAGYQRDTKSNYRYRVRYEICNHVFEAGNYDWTLQYQPASGDGVFVSFALKDGAHIPFADLELPSKVIASTMTVTDKFNSRSSYYYRYKGIRNENNPNSTGTKTVVRKTVDAIIECLGSKENYRSELKLLLSNLGLKEELFVTYSVRYKDIFIKPDMTPECLEEIFDHPDVYFPNRKTRLWGSKYFESIRKNRENLQVIASFLRGLCDKFADNRYFYLAYDVMDPSSGFALDGRAIKLLSQMDILTYPSIHVHKGAEDYLFEDSSSGETQLLCQFICVLSEMSDYSLVFIDEPENSCHPEWQMAYVNWMKTIFKKYSTSHIIIATHSHFILTNLEPDDSMVVSIERKNGSLKGIETVNPYGWLSDEVLEDVMLMRNLKSKKYLEAESKFNNALDNDDLVAAKSAYEDLLTMLHPSNVLREVLKIQMVGLHHDKD